MSLITILIIVILILIILSYFKKTTYTEKAVFNKPEMKYIEEKEDLSYLDDIIKNYNNPVQEKKEVALKPYFEEKQLHNDYRDTLTAFNNIAPDQKPKFNLSMFPEKKVDVNIEQVKPLIESFIKQLNHNIKYEVSEYQQPNNGWDEMQQSKPNENDGFRKQMRKLGLAESLYIEPKTKAKVRLIKIDNVEKYATEEQLRFVVHLILQKVNVEDQMVVKVSFVMDNKDVNLERNFFKFTDAGQKQQNVNVMIEQIFILGYLSGSGAGAVDDFYNFSSLKQDQNGITDPEEIIKELNKKFAQKRIKSDSFNVTMSPKEINDLAISRLRHDAPFMPK
jgi:hypothetical protein